jgi:hypothetical protein
VLKDEIRKKIIDLFLKRKKKNTLWPKQNRNFLVVIWLALPEQVEILIKMKFILVCSVF